MKLSELQSKDIVSIIDGKRIGSIVDVNIDDTKGTIISLVIDSNRGMFNFNKDKNAFINWSSITKIGTDVILVNNTIP